MRPGPNLVHLSTSGTPAGQAGSQTSDAMSAMSGPGKAHLATLPITVSAGATPVTATSRPGASGLWALVTIPAGTRVLTLSITGAHEPVVGVRGGAAGATVPVDVGSDAGPDSGDLATQQVLAGPDGPECASGQLGALAAQTRPGPGCPARQLTGTDATGLTQTVAFLAHQRVRSLELDSDTSPRSVAAAALVRAQAAQWHMTITDTPGPNDTLLVVSGWAGAASAVHSLVGRVGAGGNGGAVLAPWLATGAILGQATSEMVPLTFDPQRRPVREYVTTVSTIFPGETASTAGYLAWAAHTDPSTIGVPRFYGAAQINVPMGGMNDMNNNAPDAWYPGGSIVPIS
jgi:hypothetical protein